MARYVIIGVSGSGKTTIGQALAKRLDIPFHDADVYHPEANLSKMRAGIPLNDVDRAPWLDRLNLLLGMTDQLVLACSALKAQYRQRLTRDVPPVQVVYLKAEQDATLQRMRDRDHFMPPQLLQSQFDALESPTPDTALILDAMQPVDALVDAILDAGDPPAG